MKRILLSITGIIIVSLSLTSCWDQKQSPKDVVDESMKFIENKNYRGYVDLIYIENPNAPEVNDQKNLVAEYLGKIFESSFAKVGGIKGHEITSESINGETAIVTGTITLGNGSVINGDPVQLKKDVNGDWKMLIKGGYSWDKYVEMIKALGAINNFENSQANPEACDTAYEDEYPDTTSVYY
jgi:hypothetical protein